MHDTSFSAMLTSLRSEDSGFAVVLPSDWLQGRTAYGGLSAALAYAAAMRSIPGLPPLRSAQFAFIGPAMGTLSVSPKLLRQGKSTAFVGVDLVGEAGLAVHGLLCFGADRKSVIEYEALPAPAVDVPDACPDFFNSPDRPGFSDHFDARLAAGARPRTADAEPVMLVWLRHRGEACTDAMTLLLALADALPPAVMVLFPPEPCPISTMTWSLDFLTNAPVSASRWWLVRTAAQTAAAGYSAQKMTIWDDCGQPVAAMRQTVALFI